MTDLIIGIDDKLDGEITHLSPKEKRIRMKDLLTKAIDDFVGLKVPGTEKPIQLKLNTVLRSLGHECIEDIESAGLGLFADYKIGPDVLDTMLADMRALVGYSCIKRLTFRVECPIEFLSGRDGEPGACGLFPHTSFLPVGPVTDLSEDYYRDRMGLMHGRPEAMNAFSADVDLFGDWVTEVICAPKDIPNINDLFWQRHVPITPAVRPVGLKGNQANDVNAFNVERAIQAGSRGLVIASPIMGAPNRRKAAMIVLEQMGEALTA